MSTRSLRTSFSQGLAFLRDHPQVWVTAGTGMIICASFIGIAYRFGSIAEHAQEEVITVRVGSILDTFVLFAPDTLAHPEVLRGHIHALREQNPTIDSFSIVAPHGSNGWRVFISDNGAKEGSVTEQVSPVLRLAYGDPVHAYTIETTEQGERYFTTARAIVASTGRVEAVAVTTQQLAESDRNIAASLVLSYYVLGGILLLSMVLFFRHARILDFARLYQKQLEIDEMKDSFLGMASHELKSPLTVIRGYIEYLQEGTLDEGTKKEFLRRIAFSADELRQLVDDILDVSRIEMGRLRFSVDRVLPHEVCEEVATMFSDEVAKKQLTLTVDIPESVRVCAVQVDRGRLKQVLVNLTSNAIKYTRQGYVRIQLREEADRIALVVQDSGIGMTAAEREKLFNKFYRIETDETKAIAGTGLGLWITKYMIEHMQGTISVESIKGEGSRFVVSFPLSPSLP